MGRKVILITVLLQLAGLNSAQSLRNSRRTRLVQSSHRKIHLQPGSTATIKCYYPNTNGNRSRSLDGVRWYRNGIPLVLSDDEVSRFTKGMTNGRHVLRIFKVNQLDQGTYTCNGFGARATILAVGESPIFIIGPRSISLPRGKHFEVKCLATGSPTPSIRIFQDTEDITHKSRITYSGRAINVTVLKSTLLACKAENVHGMVWKNATLQAQGVSNFDEERDGSGILPLVLGSVIGFLAVLSCFLVAVWFHFRRHRSLTFTTLAKEYKLESGNFLKYSENMRTRSRGPNTPLLDSQHRDLEVSRDQIELTKEIVQGMDYTFCHGHLHSERPNGGKMQVTIKALRRHTSSKYIVKEIRLLRQLHNHYILRLTATCTLEDPQLFVFEYCPNGDLKTFLRNRNPKFLDLSAIKRYSQIGQLPYQHLGLQEKLQMAWHICKGMRYLEESNYIHKDLATRNCLVSESMVIKVSDVGLGLETYPEDYNLIGVEENSYVHLPLRWTSPECITDLEFSHKSTIWAFGVLLWEIFAYARQPYGSMSPEQVIQSIKMGRVPQRPHKCPPDVYEVIKACWRMSPKERPTFLSLEQLLSVIQNGTEV